MARKHIKATAGDLFEVTLSDGTTTIGQVLRVIDELACLGCRFFDSSAGLELAPDAVPEPIALLVVTPELVQRRIWPIIGHRSLEPSAACGPWERYRDKGWVGLKIYGAGVVSDFLAAFYGQAPWDGMADPNFFDSMLAPSTPRPTAAYYSKV